MATSTTPPSHSFPDSPGAAPARRSLQEPVLSPAEAELDMDTPEHDTGTTYTGPEGSAEGSGSGLATWWSRTEAQVGRYVGEQPGKAALMALGAGALVALLLGQRLRGRRRRN
jgi:hypothetical protein